ncbi:flagellar motor protein MotD [Lysobacter ciconiae]|uniref:Flagellar motor protein MotD n=1 Tax=Novilysobacter ciconiae TaxID=2781022 RepID=A0A7S6UGZ9_9GAMM|nr:MULTISPECIES: flagellar motor protein MotD [Lysobacter]QOW20101.1 flagellar motor protein MotD [Lysobacter ciconiae]QOY63320.1 flagellar motor protein MotD [Lysobacter sp. H21R4]
MARRVQHEEHQNHEAWAIPYADLMTLLLAFFVVMYAISSLNEGKYRVLADSLSSAFGGPPRTISPIQLGKTQLRGSAFDRPSIQTAASKAGPAAATPINSPRMLQVLDMPTFGHPQRSTEASPAAAAAILEIENRNQGELHQLGQRIQEALAELVQKKLVTVRRGPAFLEVEIQSDILFASGVAKPSPVAVETVRKLAVILRDEPNAVRVEGYTDDMPIATARFPSNWELSAARAGSVVHEMIAAGVQAARLAIVGYGEHQPVGDNATFEGRNANRRVLLVILASPQGPDAITAPLPPAVAATDVRAGSASAVAQGARATATAPERAPSNSGAG